MSLDNSEPNDLFFWEKNKKYREISLHHSCILTRGPCCFSNTTFLYL